MKRFALSIWLSLACATILYAQGNGLIVLRQSVSSVDAVRDIGLEEGASPSANNAALINAWLRDNTKPAMEIRLPAGDFYLTEPIVIPPGCWGLRLVGAGGRPFIVDQTISANQYLRYTTLVWAGSSTNVVATCEANSRTIAITSGHTVAAADRWQTFYIPSTQNGWTAGWYTIVCADPDGGTLTLDRTPSAAGSSGTPAAKIKGSMILNQGSGTLVQGIYFKGTSDSVPTLAPSNGAAVGVQTMPYSQSGEYTGTIDSGTITITDGFGAIGNGEVLDVYWKNGFRLECDGGTPSGSEEPYTVSVTGGTGDTLPTDDEPVTVVRYSGSGAGCSSIEHCAFASCQSAMLCGYGLNGFSTTSPGAFLWEDASLHGDHMEYRDVVVAYCGVGYHTRNSQSVCHTGSHLNVIGNTPIAIYHERGGSGSHTGVWIAVGGNACTMLRTGKTSGTSNASGSFAVRDVQLESSNAASQLLVMDGGDYDTAGVEISNVRCTGQYTNVATIYGGLPVIFRNVRGCIKPNSIKLLKDATTGSVAPVCKLEMCRLYTDLVAMTDAAEPQETVIDTSSAQGAQVIFANNFFGWTSGSPTTPRDALFTSGVFVTGTPDAVANGDYSSEEHTP